VTATERRQVRALLREKYGDAIRVDDDSDSEGLRITGLFCAQVTRYDSPLLAIILAA
jgi:hypothetical protein